MKKSFLVLSAVAAISVLSGCDKAPKEDTSVYVLMNIPYQAFYEAESTTEDSVNYDGISSATNKVGNYGKSGGAYHIIQCAEVTGEGDEKTVTAVGGANGAKNIGVTWPVKASSIKDVEALGGTKIIEENTLTVATVGRGQATYTDLTGWQCINEAPSYSYYELSSTPSYYMELSVKDNNPVFKATKGTAVTEAQIEPTVTYGSNWGDIQLGVSAAESISDKQINAVVISAVDSNNQPVSVGLVHLYNVWSYSDIAWKNATVNGLNGATLKNIRYYCNDKNLGYSIIDFPVDVKLLPKYTETVSADFYSVSEDKVEIKLTGMPQDATEIKAQVYIPAAGRGASATYLTPYVVDTADDDIDPAAVDVFDNVITIIPGSVTNNAGTTQSWGTPAAGTTYTIAISCKEYAPFTTTVTYSAE